MLSAGNTMVFLYTLWYWIITISISYFYLVLQRMPSYYHGTCPQFQKKVLHTSVTISYKQCIAIWNIYFEGKHGKFLSRIHSCCVDNVFTDVIRTIRDPEKPNTLEELDVVTEKCVEVQELGDDEYLIIIKFSPTVPHCSLATLIGVCER